jgi:hypothetical protein
MVEIKHTEYTALVGDSYHITRETCRCAECPVKIEIGGNQKCWGTELIPQTATERLTGGWKNSYTHVLICSRCDNYSAIPGYLA